MSGANDRRGLGRRIRDARRAYRGPFSGLDVKAVLEEEGYKAVDVDEADSFLIFQKDGCKPVPINVEWTGIYDDHAIFRCIRRDLGFTRSQLRIRLNQARNDR